MFDTPGYYRVNDRIFYSKFQALLEASRTKTEPHWNFGDEVFSLIDWTSGYCSDIRALYKQRATQLREKYDYLVLSFSGGSDSWTVLRSFLDANQKVDEILVRWPFKFTNDLFTVNRSADPANILSEWELNIKPELGHIAKFHPDIKITLYDWSDDLTVELAEEDWTNINDHMNPGAFKKFTVYGENERRMIDAGKRTAIIWGVDKPQVRYINGTLNFYFLDKLANNRFTHLHLARKPELFYWTPDMPAIAHAQARMVYEYFVRHPDQVYLTEWEGRTPETKLELNKIIRSIVYPDWNPNKFQANKPTSMVWCENDAWMFSKMKGHRYLQNWQHGLNSIKNSVHPRFYESSPTGRFEGWRGFTSQMYNLGKMFKQPLD